MDVFVNIGKLGKKIDKMLKEQKKLMVEEDIKIKFRY